jgi:hypothetical protein
MEEEAVKTTSHDHQKQTSGMDLLEISLSKAPSNDLAM